MSSTAEMQAPFADFLGIKLTNISPERVQAELTVRPELATVPDILHGGAIMALADNLGGVATVVNLPKGARTATIESKTNFFAAIPIGETAHAECTALHRGRTTMVWQTRITRNDGRLCALVIQTQIVIPAEKNSGSGKLFADQLFRGGAQPKRKPRIEALGQGFMRVPPNGDCRF